MASELEEYCSDKCLESFSAYMMEKYGKKVVCLESGSILTYQEFFTKGFEEGIRLCQKNIRQELQEQGVTIIKGEFYGN